MKLTNKIAWSSLFALFFSTPLFADITVKDDTHQFIQGYQHLKAKNPESTKKYILHYELATSPQICSIFFDGHPVPRDPQIEVMLKDYANQLPELVPIYQKKAQEIKSIVKEVEQRTTQLFGMEINAHVVLSTSVSQTDAVTTGNSAMKYPIVALNMHEMSKYSKDELRIVLAHELFHVLQHQIEDDHTNSEMIAGNIYSEGWATYASSLVYPGFADWKYISYFTKDNSQFRKFEANRKAIIHDLLKDWNSHNERKYDKYFSADLVSSHPFEPRSGYYIGYMAAKELAGKNPPVKVALIKYDDFKKQIKPILKKMSSENVLSS